MSLINISNLTFSYNNSYENIFENVSLQIDSSWKLGLIGRNGRGKTTLLKLLQGKYEYSGSITSKLSFEYFPYNIENEAINTIDIVESINPNYEYWELSKELSLLDTNDDILFRPFNTLSSGEKVKALLATLFTKQNSFLLIDEPTNHLDENARNAIIKYLKHKKGFIIISHDRDILDKCIDHIMSINITNIDIQKGNFSSWKENKDKQDKFELEKNNNLKKDIQRLNDAAKRTESWSNKVESTKFNNLASGSKPDRGYIGHKSAKLMQRAKSIESRKLKEANEKSKLLKNIEVYDDLKLHTLKYHSNILASVKNLSISYGDNVIFNNVSFEISTGDAIAITGKNGSGKSSIIKLILGENIKHNGDININQNIVISYVPQDITHLKGNLREYAITNSINESLFKTILRKLDFTREDFDKDITTYSLGQKKKVAIAKSLSQEAHLYIWDEPLNYIDIFSRMQIEKLLLEYKPTIIFVEHDATFRKNIANKIIEL